MIKNRIEGRKSLVCGIMKIKTIAYTQQNMREKMDWLYTEVGWH